MVDKAALQTRAREAGPWALERWGAFRAESPYFQAKVGLVGPYCVIVVLTAFLPPRRSTDSVNRAAA